MQKTKEELINSIDPTKVKCCYCFTYINKELSRNFFGWFSCSDTEACSVRMYEHIKKKNLDPDRPYGKST